MTEYAKLSNDEKNALMSDLQLEYKNFVAQNLHLDMARGKPSKAQLDLSVPMLSILKTADDCIDKEGLDCRNYGVIDGIPEARKMMAYLLDDDAENVIVFGNSSLTTMYDTIARLLDFGTLGSTPWASLPTIKWICPVPGYDRHFSILEQFGIEMIAVPFKDDDLDMDKIESLVKDDAAIKGIWCVPKYSNPSGSTFSDETVRRLASMECAASDFRIFWDNAYCMHHLYADESAQDQLLDIAQACKQAGNTNRYYKFASTSKITFPGAGIAGFASSPDNVAETKKLISAQMIGADKLNQLRHVRFLPDVDALHKHMSAHAAIIKPKFDIVEEKLEAGLGGLNIATWTNPRGGYFISFDGLEGTAKRTVELAKEAGVILTGAGATWPYGKDLFDSNIRIAPTLPPIEELSVALDVFICCVKIAALEVLI